MHGLLSPRTLTAIALATALAGAASAGEAPNDSPAVHALVDDVMAYLAFDASHRGRLLDGEVLYTGMPGLELTDREVAVAGAMLVIQRPPAEVAEASLGGEAFRLHPGILDVGLIAEGVDARAEIATQFDGIVFTEDEAPELQRLLRAKPGAELNLSGDEIARFRALDRNHPAAQEQAAALYRELLIERYRAYVTEGLAGIAPYDRGAGRVASAGADLRLALESAALVRRHLPDFHAALLDFPDTSVPGMTHRFHWFKRTVRKRPAFVLSHQLLMRPVDDFAAAAQVQFHSGHGYECMLTLLGAAPFEGGTLLFCGVRAFSDRVDGWPRGLRRTKGRTQLGERLASHFELLRERLEGRTP